MIETMWLTFSQKSTLGSTRGLADVYATKARVYQSFIVIGGFDKNNKTDFDS